MSRRVLVHAVVAAGERVPLPEPLRGEVWRVRTSWGLLVRLDQRLEDRMHEFPADDEARGRVVLVDDDDATDDESL